LFGAAGRARRPQQNRRHFSALHRNSPPARSALKSIRNAPVAGADVNYYHWCLNLVPNLPIPGVEKEGKIFLNSVVPEEAAQFLREVRIEQAIPA
jgi:hypothetical protein